MIAVGIGVDGSKAVAEMIRANKTLTSLEIAGTLVRERDI